MKRQRWLMMLTAMLFGLVYGKTFAQHTRTSEQTIRIQVPLQEKNNKPLAFTTAHDRPGSSAEKNSSAKKFAYTNGIVYGLMHAYCKEQIKGYNPDTLKRALPYVEFYDRMVTLIARIEGDTLIPQGRMPHQQLIPHPGYVTPLTDLTVFEPVMDLIVKRTFDPQKSVWKQDIQYIILYHKDELDFLIPKIAFKYEDVKDKILANMMLSNRHNESEIRSVKDYLDKHRYSGTITYTSRSPMMDIQQAQQAKDKLIAKEDEAWSH